MNGAESLIQTLVNGGVEVCFANPGTSEIHFVKALDQAAPMRAVLGLFEGICTGAADGYARMAGKPAATLLHLGPGLSNGLANLHNARRARSPVVNIVGDHATYHRQYDAPLTSDIVSLARPVSGWVRTCQRAEDVPQDTAAAISAAVSPPGQVATLILPADCAWSPSAPPAPAPDLIPAAPADSHRIEQIASVLHRGKPSLMLLRGAALSDAGQRLVGRIAQATGCRVMADRVNGRLPRGAGRMMIERFPYAVNYALKTLEGLAHLILVGASPPVAFFAYPDMPGWLTPENCQIHTLTKPAEDSLLALEALAETLHVPSAAAPVNKLNRPDLPSGELNPAKVWTALAALMPEQTIISDESITASLGSEQYTAGAPPHDWLTLTGGAIGLGLPMAIGAAVACPDRKVISMQADGSAMYTLQALWTQAREQLDITTILFSNRRYSILQLELKRIADGGEPGSKAAQLLDLGQPDLDWIHLAQGMGVEATRATTADELNQQLAAAIQSPGPHLIEVVM